MTRPETPFEQVSYDLNKFRERRMAERRAVPRDTADRRVTVLYPRPAVKEDEPRHKRADEGAES